MATLIFYPDAHPESSSVDGTAQHDPGGAGNWASRRDGAGTVAYDSISVLYTTMNSSGYSPQSWWNFDRAIFLFDTSALTEAVTVTAAVFETVSPGGGAAIEDTWSSFLMLVSSAPVSDTIIAAGDYDSLGTTSFSDEVTLASLADDGATYDTWTLTAAGIAAISKTGITKFGLRYGEDIADEEPSDPGSNLDARVTMASAEETLSGDKRPRLTVTYTLPFTPRAIMF